MAMATRNPDGYKYMLARLRQAREDAGLSQVDVAEALSFTQQHISRIETGDRRIDPLELLELALLYGKEVMYFLPNSADLVKKSPP